MHEGQIAPSVMCSPLGHVYFLNSDASETIGMCGMQIGLVDHPEHI